MATRTPRKSRGPRSESEQPEPHVNPAGHRIELVRLSEIKRWPRNPKMHDQPGILASMKRFGFVAPLLYDEKAGQLVAGHGRTDALQKVKADGAQPPERIQVAEDGEWLVPVIRGVGFKNEDEAAAYAIADNKLVEAGGWDQHALTFELQRLDTNMGPVAFDGLGFQHGEIKALFAAEANRTREKDPDDTPPVPVTPVSRTGDLWCCGEHRILCGDSTVAADVARVMGGEKAVLMATDPPYGVAYDNSERPNSGVAKPRVAKPRVANDEHTDGPKMQAFLESMLQAASSCMADTAAYYFWHPMLTQGTYVAAAAAAGILIHRQIIWVKSELLLGRGDYHWRHELCFYGWRQGHRCPFYGPRNQDTVWNVGYDKDRNEWNHATPKPVALWEKPLANHAKAGELVYEPFSGSGSQMIAAEKGGQRCAAMEIVPAYVDVCVLRWQAFTGKEATLEGDGRTFAVIQDERSKAV